MANKIQIRRGTNLTSAGTPEAGELIYKSDTNQLFVGNGSTAATGLTPIGGTSGSNNQILTDDGSGGINSEGNLTFDGSTLALTGDETISGVLKHSSNGDNRLTLDDDSDASVTNQVTLASVNNVNILIDGTNNGTGDFQIRSGPTTANDLDTANLIVDIDETTAIFDNVTSQQFKIGGASRTTINEAGLNVQNGSLGVGQTPPSINGSAHISNLLRVGTNGEVALTVNDGGGNANVTFNHTSKIPDRDGNSGRIEVNVDSSGGEYMAFEVVGSVTSGVSVDTVEKFRIDSAGADVTGQLKISQTDALAPIYLRDSRASYDAEISQRSDGRISLSTRAGTYGSNGSIEILDSGNVGIGTASPSNKLDVNGGITTNYGVAFTNGNTNFLQYNNSGEDVLYLRDTTNSAMLMTYGTTRTITHKNARFDSQVEFEDTNAVINRVSNDLEIRTYGGYDINLMAAGNVGIGTNAPGAKLHVDGNAIFDTDTGNQPFYITRIGTLGQALKIYVDDNDAVFESIQDETVGTVGNFKFVMDSDTAANTRFLHGTAEKFKIESGGNVVMQQGSRFYLDSGGDTYIQSDIADTLRMVAGNINMIEMIENDTQDQVIIGNGTSDVDFIVEDDAGVAVFKVDAGTSNTTITGDLDVSGNFGITTLNVTTIKNNDSPADTAMTIDSSGRVTFSGGPTISSGGINVTGASTMGAISMSGADLSNVRDINLSGILYMDSSILIDTNRRFRNSLSGVGADIDNSIHVVDFATPATPGATGWYTICKASSANARGGGIINLSATGGSITPATITIDFFVDWSGNLVRCNTQGISGQFSKVRLIQTASTTELQIYVNTTVVQDVYVSFEKDRYNPNYSLLNPWATATPTTTGDEVLLRNTSIYSPISNTSALVVSDNARRLLLGRDSIQSTDLSGTAQQLYINSNTTFSGTVTVPSTLNANGNIYLADNQTLYVGTDTTNGLRLFHLSANNNNYVRSNGGALSVETIAAQPIYFNTNSTSAMAIDSSQRVGIGTTSPAYKLDVSGGGRFTGHVDFDSTITIDSVLYGSTINTSGELNFTGNGNKIIDVETLSGSNYLLIRHHNPVGNLFENALKLTANGSAQLYYNNISKFETTSTGAKITGTTNSDLFSLQGAGSSFELIAESGDATSINSLAYRLGLRYGSNDNGYIDFYRGPDGATGFLSFGTSGTERMRINSSGLIKVGPNGGDTTNVFEIDTSGSTQHGLMINADEARAAGRYALLVDDEDPNSRGSVVIQTASGPSLTTTGSVGIGTASPARKLHVSTGNTDIAARFENTTSNGTVMELISSGDGSTLYFQTDHIYGSGNLYLGGGTNQNIYRGSSHTFQVGSGNTTNITLNSNQLLFAQPTRIQFANDQRIYDNGGGGLRVGAASYALELYSGGTSPISFITGGISGTTRFQMTYDGQFKWGSAADYGTLTWDTGKAIITSQGSNDLEIRRVNSSDMIDFEENQMRFVADGTERMRVSQNGVDLSANSANKILMPAASTRDKYRVWNSSTYAIGMQTNFTFGGLGTDYAMTFQMSNTATRGFWWGDSAHGQTAGAMALTTEGKLTVAHSARIGYGESDTTTPGATYRLDVSGSIGATADVVAYISSDERLKDNIKNISNPLEKLKKLNGVEFDWNDKQDLYKGHDIGVIAQEVEEVLPEIVDTREDGYKAVKYDRMVALLIEAVKEQQQQINELKEKLNG